MEQIFQYADPGYKSVKNLGNSHKNRKKSPEYHTIENGNNTFLYKAFFAWSMLFFMMKKVLNFLDFRSDLDPISSSFFTGQVKDPDPHHCHRGTKNGFLYY